MGKYIVTNCPNCELDDWENGYGELEEGYLCKVSSNDFECKDIDNCLIKKVIDRNNEVYKQYHTFGSLCGDCNDEVGIGLATDMLSMFEMSEVAE